MEDISGMAQGMAGAAASMAGKAIHDSTGTQIIMQTLNRLDEANARQAGMAHAGIGTNLNITA